MSGHHEARFQETWATFLAAGMTEDHAARIRERFGAGDAWSIIVPVGEAPVRARAAEVQAALAGLACVRPVSLESLHVTVYMEPGTPPDGWLERIEAALEGPGTGTASAGGANAFPQGVFLELGDTEPLDALRRTIEEAVGSRSASSDAFLPHITVATFGEPAVAVEAVAGRLAPHRELPPLAVPVAEVVASRVRFDEQGEVHTIEDRRVRGGTAQA